MVIGTVHYLIFSPVAFLSSSFTKRVQNRSCLDTVKIVRRQLSWELDGPGFSYDHRLTGHENYDL